MREYARGEAHVAPARGGRASARTASRRTFRCRVGAAHEEHGKVLVNATPSNCRGLRTEPAREQLERVALRRQRHAHEEERDDDRACSRHRARQCYDTSEKLIIMGSMNKYFLNNERHIRASQCAGHHSSAAEEQKATHVVDACAAWQPKQRHAERRPAEQAQRPPRA